MKPFNFKEFIRKEQRPVPATDIIIRYKSKIVLIERKYHPLGIAFPGGLLDYGLTYEQNAIKEAKEETGLDVILVTAPNRPFGSYSDPDADPRHHIPTNVYIGDGYGVLKPHKDEDAKRAFGVSRKELSDLLKKPELWAFKRHIMFGKEYLEAKEYK